MNSTLLCDFEELYSRHIDWHKFNNTTFLISGAYGMLASYIILFFSYLKDNKGINTKIVALVRSKKKFYERMPECELKEQIYIYESNLETPLSIDFDVDYIIHAASPATPNCFSQKPADVIIANTVGTYNLLELAVRKKVKSFLMISSGDVYGDTGDETIIQEDTLGKIDPLDLHSCYGEGKRAAENMCFCYYKQYSVPTKIARLAHTYSPTMNLQNDTRVFASFVNDVLAGRDIIMYSDGKALRPFCYVEDAVHGFFRILLDGNSGEAYNVCSEYMISVGELAEILVNLCPKKNISILKKERKITDSYLPNKTFQEKKAHLSNRKLKNLGWNEFVGVSEGFRRVFSYLSER